MAKPASTDKNRSGAAHGSHDHVPHGGGGGHDDGHGGGGGHCPPPWILTFADMATLLMAFFVLMLMPSKPDTPKFNAFAAAMRETFGRAPLDPNDADKGGTSILDLNFGPQSGEQTNEPPATTPQSGDPAQEGSGKSQGKPDTIGGLPGDGVDQAAEALAKAMRDAVAAGQIEVQSDAGNVVVRLPSGSGAEAAQQIADAMAAAAGTEAGPLSDPEAKAAAEQAAANAAGAKAGEGAGAMADGGAGAQAGKGVGAQAGNGPGAGGEGKGDAGVRAEMAALKIGAMLQEQVTNGSVQVEQRDGKVFVTVSAGGAFSSGSADLTQEAREIVKKLELASGRAESIVVTGHTDNVPLSGSTYKDNWELASARSASVVREIEASGLVPGAKLVATGMGDTAPVAENTDDAGRARNRRIEIEIQFADQ